MGTAASTAASAAASTARETNNDTGQLKHTLDIVLDTLPIVSELCSMLRNELSKKDRRHGYLGNVNASMAILERQLRDIRNRGDSATFEPQIKDLAEYLGQIFRLAPNKAFGYSGLQAVQAAWTQSGQKNSPEHFLDPEAIESPNRWNLLQRKLKSLVDEVQSYGEDTYDYEDTSPPKVLESDSETWAFANRAFDAVCCKCHAGAQKKIRLKIGTYKPKSLLQPKSLCILLADSQGWSDWHEMIIHDHLERMPKVKFTADNQAAEVTKRHSTSEAVLCVYTAVKDFSASLLRFDFVLRRDILFQSRKFVDERILLPDTLQEEINLKSLMSSRRRKWPETVKWSLAVMLSYSLHHLYGGSWTQSGWGRDNILFFRSGSRIPLRPFLGLSLIESDHQEKQEMTSFHRYPEILELGVILLELHLGQRLERFLGLGHDLTDSREIYTQALILFGQQKFHIFSLEYRNAIATCLWPDLKLESGSSRADLRTMLLHEVVIPLEKELTRNFQEWLSDNAIDEQAAGFDLANGDSLPEASGSGHEPLQRLETNEGVHPLFRKQQPQQNMYQTDTPGGLFVPHYDSTYSENIGGARASKGKDAEPTPNCELFGGIECTSTSNEQCQKTDKWKKEFKSLMEKHLGSKSDRLKVAVLDSGVAEHIDFGDEERIVDRKSWIKDSEHIDESGHGTHIIGTILEMTENVDVYVGRISKSRYISETNHIAEAIKYAREIQKVDIISLSFGFKALKKSIQEEIKTSIDQGILIFAAASNDGGNSSRAFPARQDGVFCIHSATSEGNRSSYNPSPEKHGDNFSVVGDSVKSCWLNDEWKYMSGTSFATPMAISVVAFMYSFICQEIPLHIDLPISAKSPEGMRRILRLMKEPRDGYDWISPLLYFEKFSKEKIVADIKHVLSR